MSKSLNIFIKTCFTKRNKKEFVQGIYFVYSFYSLLSFTQVITLYYSVVFNTALANIKDIFRMLLNICEGAFCKNS